MESNLLVYFDCQEFHSYSDEDDEERIQQIISSAITDSQWVVDKVNDNQYQAYTNTCSCLCSTSRSSGKKPITYKLSSFDF